jgi:hypothetical protein
VVALRKDLVATAHALELAADFLHPVGLLLGQKRENCEKDECEKRRNQATELRTKRSCVV